MTASGRAIIAGATGSTNFSTTRGAYDTHLSGTTDAYIAEFNEDGTALVFSTLIGGTSSEAIYQTMERFKLISRTRGGAPLQAEKREGVS